MKILIRLLLTVFICFLIVFATDNVFYRDRFERIRAACWGNLYTKNYRVVYERDESNRMENIVLSTNRKDGTLSMSEFYDHIYVENIGDEDFHFEDTHAYLEFLKDGKWYTVPSAGISFEMGHRIEPGSKNRLIAIHPLNNPEIPGHYRVVLEEVYFSEEAVQKYVGYIDRHGGKFPQIEFIADIAELKWTAVEVDVIDE